MVSVERQVGLGVRGLSATPLLLHRKLCQPQSAGGLPGDPAASSPPREHGSSASPPQVGVAGMGVTAGGGGSGEGGGRGRSQGARPDLSVRVACWALGSGPGMFCSE